ncbi:MAG: DUF4369 domain-containing protein [Bacteroidales bacterium]|nr:DUF4369 domain-containing protein [Bacteroidales bacterium]
MNKVLVIATLVLLLVSCSKDNTYTIEGTLYGGTSFEGETIYMVPFGSSSVSGQDSAIIRNGRFRFEGNVDIPEICEIRMRPMMRLFVDKLICIKEPGHVWVTLNKRSTAKGTSLNDSLQAWRDYKYKTDSILVALNKQMKRATSEDLEKIQQEYDRLQSEFDNHNKAIVQRNDNAFGEYIDRFVR